MNLPSFAPHRRRERVSRRRPQLGGAAFVALLLAVSGCQNQVNPRQSGYAFQDPDPAPAPTVNDKALAALRAAAVAAAKAAAAADDQAVTAAATQAFTNALDAASPPPLVSHGSLASQIADALAAGIASGIDETPGAAKRTVDIAAAVAAAAKAEGCFFDATAVVTAVTAVIAKAGTVGVLRSDTDSVKADPKTAAETVTTAILQSPGQAGEIVKAAIAATPGQASEIVRSAIAAASGQTYLIAPIVVSAIAVAPNQASAIIAAAIAAAPSQDSAIEVMVASAIGAAPDHAIGIVKSAIVAAPMAAGRIMQIAVLVSRVQGDVIRQIQEELAKDPGLSNLTRQAISDAIAAQDTASVPLATGSVVSVTGSSWGGGMSVPPPTGSPGGGGSGQIIVRNREFATVRVLYATDRKPIMDLAAWQAELPKVGSSHEYYGPEIEVRGQPPHSLRYGRCFVSIPAVHKKGGMERPGTLSAEVVVKHLMLRGITELDVFTFQGEVGRLTRADAEHPKGRDVFVFIHGFNVTFNEAVMRAAQMAYDFGFLGAPIVYSWSSRGSAMITAMQHDQENIGPTVDRLRKFIVDVQKHTEGNVHLVAHSMGNRALVAVLKKLAEDWNDARGRIALRPGRTRLFGEIVLAAPDVPETDFTAADAKAVKELADRVSLYVADDRALSFARGFSSHRRLGQSGEDLFVADGVETINASGVEQDLFSLRHSYPFNVQRVLDDLKAIIVNRARPDAPPRNLKREQTSDRQAYWSMVDPVR